MLFLYGMRCRPFSIGTFPKEGFERVEHLTESSDKTFRERYRDILVYNRKLTGEELDDFEFDYIGGV